MKNALIFALVIGGASTAFADAPSLTDMIHALNSYYANNSKFQSCLQQLRPPTGGYPPSVKYYYTVALEAAAFAEGLPSSCK